MTSVYIHIPFCERICSYCDFPKRVGTPKHMTDYLEALDQEISFYPALPPLDTLYIGGGTPSILSGVHLERLRSIVQRFRLNSGYEFTVECNPEHITEDRLEVFHRMGVNRISLGVQTFQPKLLKILNRGHRREQVFDAIERLKKHGFHNITIDLMFALPLQKLDDLYDDLATYLSLDLPHLSAYSLILEDQTVLSYQVSKKQVSLIENETEALMYQIVMDTLKGNGYHHYEISNFAKSGYESIHNQVYWQNQHYFGFGMGASGYINEERYYNADRLTEYLDLIKSGQKPIQHVDKIDDRERLREAMMLGLRRLDGIDIEAINRQYQTNVLDVFDHELAQLQRNGWIRIDSHIRLTGNGLFYGNEVFGTFL